MKNYNLRTAVKNKDVKSIAYFLFKAKLTEAQQTIVRKIAYSESKRLQISAMTRYGKTYCAAIGICLYILFNKDKRIALIAPQGEQAEILRNYLSELILSNPILTDLADLENVSGVDRLKKEASKNRLTFKNGCEYKIFSAYYEAQRLMGFGADLIVCDEAALITHKAYTKIMRMLGDDPENAILIELYNPWTRDSKAFEHYLSGNFEILHIDWRVALKEGRTTEAFITEQQQNMTELEFAVLYESRFPEEEEDSIFRLSDIEACMTKEPHIKPEAKKIIDSNISKHNYKQIIACDVADKGLDETVIMWGYYDGNEYEIVDTYSEKTSENMQIVSRIIATINQFCSFKMSTDINIDSIGVGVGVISALKAQIKEKNWQQYVKVNACHFGEQAIQKDKFANKKAENYFRAENLIHNQTIKLPKIEKLKNQLLAMKWEFAGSTGKIKILDPENYSPDWSDCLVYFCWKDKNKLSFRFL